tara:strand:+ start:176 stop:736 length:561 start_codon:yes stop_codon:yes gene_type:complete
MSEYRTHHIDKDAGFLYVDYYKTEDQDEEGKVIANIDIHNLDVFYEDETHKNNPKTQAIINETKEKLKTMEFEVMTDICYDCGRVQSYGTMQDINEDDFDIFCDDCFYKHRYKLVCHANVYPLQYFKSLKDVRSWSFNHARLQLEMQYDLRDPKDIGHDVNLKLLDTYELAEYFDFTLETNVKPKQ